MAEEEKNKQLEAVHGMASVPAMQSQPWKVSQRRIVRAVGVAAFIGLAGWLFQNFLTLRGVVDLAVSRIDLVVCCAAIFAAAWILTVNLRRQTIWRCIIGLAIFLTGLGVDWWAPRPEVIVSPRAMNFRESYLENFPLAVKNKTDDYVYGVQLVIRLQKDSPLAAYRFDVPFSTRKPIIEGSKFADIAGVQCSDRDGRPMAIFWIYRMAPGETREFSVTHLIGSITSVNSVIGGFTKDPLPRIDDITQMTGFFRATEPMTCNGAYGYGLDPRMPPRTFSLKVQRAK